MDVTNNNINIRDNNSIKDPYYLTGNDERVFIIL